MCKPLNKHTLLFMRMYLLLMKWKYAAYIIFSFAKIVFLISVS